MGYFVSNMTSLSWFKSWGPVALITDTKVLITLELSLWLSSLKASSAASIHGHTVVSQLLWYYTRGSGLQSVHQSDLGFSDSEHGKLKSRLSEKNSY